MTPSPAAWIGVPTSAARSTPKCMYIAGAGLAKPGKALGLFGPTRPAFRPAVVGTLTEAIIGLVNGLGAGGGPPRGRVAFLAAGVPPAGVTVTLPRHDGWPPPRTRDWPPPRNGWSNGSARMPKPEDAVTAASGGLLA